MKNKMLFSFLIEWIKFRFRWIVIIAVIVPLSFFYNYYLSIRNNIMNTLGIAIKVHARKVNELRKEVKNLFPFMTATQRAIYAPPCIMQMDRKRERKRGPASMNQCGQEFLNIFCEKKCWRKKFGIKVLFKKINI